MMLAIEEVDDLLQKRWSQALQSPAQIPSFFLFIKTVRSPIAAVVELMMALTTQRSCLIAGLVAFLQTGKWPIAALAGFLQTMLNRSRPLEAIASSVSNRETLGITQSMYIEILFEIECLSLKGLCRQRHAPERYRDCEDDLRFNISGKGDSSATELDGKIFQNSQRSSKRCSIISDSASISLKTLL